jgi:hypothetical protein|tara:strand:- start:142 stop:402 length:261 start_codon:yes stop_codon:yes gene_type:complete
MILEILLGVLVIAEGYVIWNLTKKTELLEGWVETFTQRIQLVQDTLKTVDSKGYFETDDEVGSIFERIKQIINELDNLKGDEINAK